MAEGRSVRKMREGVRMRGDVRGFTLLNVFDVMGWGRGGGGKGVGVRRWGVRKPESIEKQQRGVRSRDGISGQGAS